MKVYLYSLVETTRALVASAIESILIDNASIDSIKDAIVLVDIASKGSLNLIQRLIENQNTVIAMIAGLNHLELVSLIEMGVDDVLVLPATPEDIRFKVRRWERLRQL